MNIYRIFSFILALLVLWFVFTYNNLIRRRNRAKEAWSDIDVQLKRRYDLIPNLVEAVKGYLSHEKNVLEKVTAARTLAMGAKSMSDHVKSENMLEGALKSLFAVSENYPALRATENFQKLQDELSDTENKIQAARRFYNSNSMDLNTAIETFPNNLVAGAFRFKKAEFFEIKDEVEKEAVKINF